MRKNKLLLIILFSFVGYPYVIKAQQYQIVIDELMADPSPQVGLPNNEWIELKNTTAAPVNLAGWKIGDAGGSSGPMPPFILQPDSFVIVCSSTSLAVMSTLGPTIAVTNFPLLDNNGDQLTLRDAQGRTIHSVGYNISWYQNELKQDGGWALEMIDPQNPCSGNSNWKASINNSGGTPGRTNSVNAVNKDSLPPQLKRAYILNDLTIILVFDEPIDSLKAATNNNYTIDGGLTIVEAATPSPLFDKVQLTLNAPMEASTVYTITANNIADCSNNVVGNNRAKVGLPVDAMPGDMVINEILSNPRPNAYDYIELYNKSNKILDASRLYLANRNSSNAISSAISLTSTAWLVFPGDHIVVTEDAASLAREYLVKNPDFVFTVSSLPSFPDDKGYVLILNQQGNIVDEADYLDEWHFKLISNSEGVALERIDPDGLSQNQYNWHSAGSGAGYGTPTYTNSQRNQSPVINAIVEVVPKLFSPDNDGFEDIATVQYKVGGPGFVANVIIFDAAGRAVRNLVRNGLLALTGYWNWDGLDDKGQKLPIGAYIIFTEIFNLHGDKDRFKNAVILARKLK